MNRPDAHTFGFNGQERKDHYKGKGNHNHALYWEYDTRIGRRWNLDPKPNAGISDYASFANSPVQYSDKLGDSIGVKGFKQEKILKDLNRGILVDKAHSPYSFNNTGKLVIDDQKFNTLNKEQQDIASTVRTIANSSLDVQIVKGKWRDPIPDMPGKTLSDFGGAATYANIVNGVQDVTGKSGITIRWTGKGESIYLGIEKQTLYQTNSTSLYHEMGHTFYRFIMKDPKQAAKTVDYENKVRNYSAEMLPEYRFRDYDDYHKP